MQGPEVLSMAWTSPWALSVLTEPSLWAMGSEWWVLVTGCWVVGAGQWVMGAGYWVMGSG